MQSESVEDAINCIGVIGPYPYNIYLLVGRYGNKVKLFFVHIFSTLYCTKGVANIQYANLRPSRQNICIIRMKLVHLKIQFSGASTVASNDIFSQCLFCSKHEYNKFDIVEIKGNIALNLDNNILSETYN